MRDFYTIVDGSDNRSDHVEKHFYEPIDDYLGKLLKEIELILREGQIPSIVGEQKESFDHLIVSLFKRTIDVSKVVDEEAAGRKFISRVDELTDGDLSIRLSRRPRAAGRIGSRELGRSFRVEAQASYSEVLVSALANYDIHFVQAEARNSFVLGSRIVYKTLNGTKGSLGDKEVQLWMPIGPKWAIVMAHRQLNLPKWTVWSQPSMDEMNEYIVRDSLAAGSHSEQLLLALTGGVNLSAL